ncbi:hypothetical protein GCM10009789_55320 [Kribbella sancticallisti]|uniref:N-acetylmuramoyl-L-alanine amidase n=1 Tax=Kribbella sancticallisti TaxID=460087 RepID=A0ABP4Q069_9ACTN
MLPAADAALVARSIPGQTRSFLIPPGHTGRDPGDQANHPDRSTSVLRAADPRHLTRAPEATKVLQTAGLRLLNPRWAQYWWLTPSPV